jgi:hypothetical protein
LVPSLEKFITSRKIESESTIRHLLEVWGQIVFCFLALDYMSNEAV